MSKTGTAIVTDDLIQQYQEGSAQMTRATAIALAGEMYTRGRHRQAIHICRQILASQPGCADAHNIIGVSLSALGKAPQGIVAIQRAIELSPNTANYYANLGEIQRLHGDSTAAGSTLKQALALDPANAQALNNLGIVHFEGKDYESAVAFYHKALAIVPGMAEAWNNLGNSLRLIDDIDGAAKAYENALSLRETYPEAYNNLGTLLQEQSKHHQAVHALKKAIAQNPTYADAYNNLASVYVAEENEVEALRQLGEVLRFAPSNAKSLVLVARIQLRRGSYPLAEQACALVLKDDPANVEALTVLGQLKHETDDYQAAMRLLEAAVQADPENAEARNFYGVTLKSAGRLDEAREQILKSIELNGKMLGAYANLNDLVDFAADQTLLTKLESLLEADGNPEEARKLPLHFAYANALEHKGEHARALDHYIIGGRIKRTLLNYVEADTFGFFDAIAAAFPADVFSNRPFAGNPSDRPVFIVGMPRSGSTLIEQILSSHPLVHGAGEVKYLSREIHMLRDRFPSLSAFPEIFRELNDQRFSLLADGYLQQHIAHSGDAARVTDKLLTNYFFVGLINIMFPHAKIINTLRNPVDNCLSAFTKLFKDDMPHSYDLGELGRYYRKYQSLMDHWNAVLPNGTMATIRYEDVVEDTEGAARRLIEFIGLPWDPTCLKFYDSVRPVKTASVAQIRRPIYKDSVNRWEKYGPGLQPLLDALESPL